MTKDLSDVLFRVLGKKEINLDSEIHKQIGYEVFKKHFNFVESRYDSFYQSFTEDAQKLGQFRHIVHFYYLWCKRPSVWKNLKPDFKLIIMFSVIESVMVEKKHITFSDWLKKSFEEDTLFCVSSVTQLDSLLEKYHGEFGSRKAVRAFFDQYYVQEDLASLMAALKVLNKTTEEYENIPDMQQLLRFIESVRNGFIHEAQWIPISSEEKYREDSLGYTSFGSSTLDYRDKKVYDIDNAKFHIEAILDGFERALIKFFESQKTV